MKIRHISLLSISLLAAPFLHAIEPGTPEGRLLENIKVLASDAFEGRAPGSKGEDLTVAYIEQECRKIGLLPGNPDGTYVQQVPLVGVSTQTSASWAAGDKTGTWKANTDIVAPSLRMEPHLALKDSELVFVGYGVTAPEFGWDDYKGQDVRGKTVVMLINDPPVPSRDNPAMLDPKVFGGEGMTYYGRWTYKYENAAAHGAAACLIIHETVPAAYPFSVVVDSRSRENFGLLDREANNRLLTVEGWLSLDAAKALLSTAGLDFATLKQSALNPGFRPVPLHAKASFDVNNTVREVSSRNVAALLPGTDAKLKNEYIIISAHWDHLGRNPALQGDQIYHGALDNASGVAQILEIARELSALPAGRRLKRSVLCLFPTSEEKNLLGAKHYMKHPLHPLEQTIADLNVDMANPYSPTDDIAVIGIGASSIEDQARVVAASQNRTLVGDRHPGHGSYYRADHFEFARAGVPCFYLSTGEHYRGKPDDFSRRVVAEYISTHYHKVTDAVQPDWTLEGAALDAAFLARLCESLSATPEWPRWYDGNEFKARRDAMLGKARP